MSEPALRLEGVTKRFADGDRTVSALDAVDIEVPAGRICGLIGPDGAGKTTLMRLAAGLLTPEAGRVVVLGIDAAAEPQSVQAAVGYMPQRCGRSARGTPCRSA
jgi:ABC-2 type transport system ATP-binding protein